MKNSKRKILSIILCLAFVAGIVCVPMPTTVTATDTNPFTGILSPEWSLGWNGNSAVSADEFVSVVSDEVKVGNNSLRIGHPTERTQLTLKLQIPVTEAKNYSYSLWYKATGTITDLTLYARDGADGLGTGNIIGNALTSQVSTDWQQSANNEIGIDTGVFCLDVGVDCEAGNYVYLDNIDVFASDKPAVHLNPDTSFERWREVSNGNKNFYHSSEFVKVVSGVSKTGDKSLRIGSDKTNTNITLEMKVPVISSSDIQMTYGFYAKTEGSISSGVVTSKNNDGNKGATNLTTTYSDWTNVEAKKWISNGYMNFWIAITCEKDNYIYIDDVYAYPTADTGKHNQIYDSSFEAHPVMTQLDTVPLATQYVPYWAQAWSGDQTQKVDYITTAANSGSAALALTFPNTTKTSGGLSYTYENIVTGLEPETEYTFEGYLKTIGAPTTTQILIGPNNGARGKINFGTPAEYTKFTKTFTTAANETEIELGIYFGGKVDDVILADDFTIYKTADAEKTNLMKNGGFELRFPSGEDFTITRINELEEWSTWIPSTPASTFSESVGKIKDGENTQLIYYNKDKAFQGSIIKHIYGLENGTYTATVKYRSPGYGGASLAAENYGGAKMQTMFSSAASYDFRTVKLENIPVTDNRMDLTVYANGNAGQWLIIDDVTLTRTDIQDANNYVKNGDFETSYETTTAAPEKLADNAQVWQLSASDGDPYMAYVSKKGYESTAAYAVNNTAAQTLTLSQKVTGLTDGKYVLTAYAKRSAGHTDATMLVQGHNTNGINAFAKIPVTGIWTPIAVEFEVNTGEADVKFYVVGNQNDWLMFDNVRLFRKDTPSVNLIQNGDFEELYVTGDTFQIEYTNEVDGWTSWVGDSSQGDFGDSVGFITEQDSKRVIFYNANDSFTGSITQKIPELENGNYNVTIKARTAGYKSAVVAAQGYNAENTDEKIQKAINVLGTEMTEIKLENIAVTNNSITVSVYADGLAGEWLVIDDVIVTKADDTINLVFNGDFETKLVPQTAAPTKAEGKPSVWKITGDDEAFLTSQSRSGSYAFAFVNNSKKSSYVAQTVEGLENGTYIVSAWVKSSGGQNAANLVVRDYKSGNTGAQAVTAVPQTGVWTRIEREVEVTSGKLTASIYNDGNDGNWLMVDDLKLYLKSNPAVNLLPNNGFEELKPVVDPSTFNIQRVAKVAYWSSWIPQEAPSAFNQSVGYVNYEGSNRVIFYNADKAFEGSITQHIKLDNGKYDVSVQVRTDGYQGAVVAVNNHNKDNASAKIQKSIVTGADGFETVTLSGVEVTNGQLSLAIYGKGLAGEWIMVDNATVVKEGTTENLVKNGDFETTQEESKPALNPATLDIKRTAKVPEWTTWIPKEAPSAFNQSVGFVNYEGSNRVIFYNANKAFEGSITQHIKLDNGKYDVSVQVRTDGYQGAVVAVNNHNKDNTSAKIQKSIVTGEDGFETVTIRGIEVTNGQLSLAIYGKGLAGEWIMVDNATVVKEGTTENLVKNGDFETMAEAEKEKLDPSKFDIQYLKAVPKWKSWVSDKSGSTFEQSVGLVKLDGGSSVIFYNAKKAFTGSITQHIKKLEDGVYTATVRVRTDGYKSAVIAVNQHNKADSAAKIQKSIVLGEDGFATVTLSGIEVTSGQVALAIYAEGLAGQWLIIDDVTFTKDGTTKNLVENGDFERKAVSTEFRLPPRAKRMPAAATENESSTSSSTGSASKPNDTTSSVGGSSADLAPTTGDTSLIYGAVMLFLASVMTFVITFKRKKRSK